MTPTSFVSVAIARKGLPRQLVLAWRRGVFHLVTSREQQAEITGVLSRPKLAEKYGVSQLERAAMLRRIQRQASKARPLRRLPVDVRDPKDEVILATALGGHADYLVTGDDDLLVLNGDPRLEHLRIVTVRTFLETVRELPPPGPGDER